MISLRHSKRQGRHCIGEALRQGQLSLGDVSDAPSLDAQWLLLHVLGKKEASWLQAHGDEELSDKEECEYRKLVKRRGTGEPLAYILGYWEFYGRRFLVNKDVMVPRPSTEDLVDETLKVIMKMARRFGGRPLTVADIGTGSGCIIITLALELANFQFFATDISPAALIMARKNARIHGVLDRIEFLEGDMLKPLKDKKIDLIVSNPPYLLTEEILPFEPREALDGGTDGQDFIKQIEMSGIPAVVEGPGGQIQ